MQAVICMHGNAMYRKESAGRFVFIIFLPAAVIAGEEKKEKNRRHYVFRYSNMRVDKLPKFAVFAVIVGEFCAAAGSDENVFLWASGQWCKCRTSVGA